MLSELTGVHIEDLDVRTAAGRLGDFTIVDVRRPDEFTGPLGHVAGATLHTLGDALDRYLREAPKTTPHLFVCRRGGRSAKAARQALEAGFPAIFNLDGGMEAWNEARLPAQSS